MFSYTGYIMIETKHVTSVRNIILSNTTDLQSFLASAIMEWDERFFFTTLTIDVAEIYAIENMIAPTGNLFKFVWEDDFANLVRFTSYGGAAKNTN